MIEKTLQITRQRGVTLVELLIVIGIVAILAAFAGPSFVDFRDRAALRAAGNEVQSVIDNARFEAVQRDRPVTVSFRNVGATVWCVGAREGRVACNCLELNPAAATFCSVDRYPAFNPSGSAADIQAPLLLKRVALAVNPSFGSGGATSFVFDPKLGTLEDPALFGGLTLENTAARAPYQVRVNVSPLGAVRTCDVVNGGHAVFGIEPC